MTRFNLKLTICYDGTHYYGWQQTKAGSSIEECLRQALKTITPIKELKIQAASRTDRGVHAQGQVVQFFSHKFERLKEKLNAALPKDIRVLDVETKDPLFHPSLDAKAKKYIYFICNRKFQLPVHRYFSWHFYRPLSIARMNQAAQILLGEHDFSSFSCQLEENPYCTIHSIKIKEIESFRIAIEITGNHFLYKMIRTIIGTLAYVGCGKTGADEIQAILLAKDRRKSGVTAPAHGLFLNNVYYN